MQRADDARQDLVAGARTNPWIQQITVGKPAAGLLHEPRPGCCAHVRQASGQGRVLEQIQTAARAHRNPGVEMHEAPYRRCAAASRRSVACTLFAWKSRARPQGEEGGAMHHRIATFDAQRRLVHQGQAGKTRMPSACNATRIWIAVSPATR
ncbi:MAG: hypothetical protein R3E96_09830 [Planctomycetota bacterium]